MTQLELRQSELRRELGVVESWGGSRAGGRRRRRRRRRQGALGVLVSRAGVVARRRRLIARVILAVRAHPFPVVAAVFVLIQLCRDMLVLVARDHRLVAHAQVALATSLGCLGLTSLSIYSVPCCNSVLVLSCPPAPAGGEFTPTLSDEAPRARQNGRSGHILKYVPRQVAAMGPTSRLRGSGPGGCTELGPDVGYCWYTDHLSLSKFFARSSLSSEFCES